MVRPYSKSLFSQRQSIRKTNFLHGTFAMLLSMIITKYKLEFKPRTLLPSVATWINVTQWMAPFVRCTPSGLIHNLSKVHIPAIGKLLFIYLKHFNFPSVCVFIFDFFALLYFTTQHLDWDLGRYLSLVHFNGPRMGLRFMTNNHHWQQRLVIFDSDQCWWWWMPEPLPRRFNHRKFVEQARQAKPR